MCIENCKVTYIVCSTIINRVIFNRQQQQSDRRLDGNYLAQLYNHHKHAGYDNVQCNSVSALMRIAASIVAGTVMTITMLSQLL